MAGFEDVVIRALEKHDNATPIVREQVYNAARAALEKLLSKSDKRSPENIVVQRQKLETAILDIEAGYAVTAYKAVEDYIDVENQVLAQHSGDTAPVVEVTPLQVDAGISKFPTDERQKSRRHPYAALLFGTIILAAIGIGAWWAYNQNLTMPAELRDNSVPNPPRILAEEQSPEETALESPVNSGANNEQISIFDPADPTGLIADGTISANLASDSGGNYIRLAGKVDAPDGSVKIVVDPGVMEIMAGKRVKFDLNIKSSVGEGHQFIVTCQFRELGDCGRKRFTASLHAQSYVFQTKLANEPLSGSDKSGSITIIVDASGKGLELDLYSVQVTASN